MFTNKNNKNNKNKYYKNFRMERTIIDMIDECIANNDYKKAFFVIIMLIGKLEENDKNDVFVYYKHKFLSNNLI